MIERLKTWWHYLAEHRTKVVGICGVVAGCTQNYLESNNIAFIPQKWRGVLVAGFGAITFCVGLFNSIRMASRDEH